MPQADTGARPSLIAGQPQWYVVLHVTPSVYILDQELVQHQRLATALWLRHDEKIITVKCLTEIFKYIKNLGKINKSVDNIMIVKCHCFFFK